MQLHDPEQSLHGDHMIVQRAHGTGNLSMAVNRFFPDAETAEGFLPTAGGYDYLIVEVTRQYRVVPRTAEVIDPRVAPPKVDVFPS